MRSNNSWFFNSNTQEFESLKKKNEKALHDTFEKAEAGDWEAVIDLGLSFPVNMDRIIDCYYDSMPDKIRYLLPVKWYMATGKASDSVCKAVKLAYKYRPAQWIGKGAVKGDIIDVFCCLKQGNKEDAKACLSWSIDYGSAYINAMKINGKIFQACISKDKMIAYNPDSLEPVIQYGAVYAVQQSFPVLPLSCLEKKGMMDYAQETTNA